MSLYRYELICPRCAKWSEHVSGHGGEHFTPRISCGDCLIDMKSMRLEIVELKVVSVRKIECAHDWQSDATVDLIDVCSICGEERA